MKNNNQLATCSLQERQVASFVDGRPTSDAPITDGTAALDDDLGRLIQLR